MKENLFTPDVSLAQVVAMLPPEVKNNLLAQYDMKSFAKLFEDGETCEMCRTLFSCRLNVSATARKLFMHRNTLIYRLDNIREQTGLELREFDAAVTFEVLYFAYKETRKKQ